MLKDLLVILGVADAEAARTVRQLEADTCRRLQLTQAVTAWKTEGTLYVVAHGDGVDFKLTQRGRLFSIDVGHCSFASLSPTSWPAFTKQVAFLLSFVRGGLKPGDDRIARVLAIVGVESKYNFADAFEALLDSILEVTTDFPPYTPPPPPPFNGMAPSYPWMRYH